MNIIPPHGFDCDTDDYLSYDVPQVEVEQPHPDDEPTCLLGPDGEPLPRVVFPFGFSAGPVLR